jgi:uncharacterized protein (TIGR03067 family)
MLSTGDVRCRKRHLLLSVERGKQFATENRSGSLNGGFMLSQVFLPIALAFLPLNDLSDYLTRVRLVGTWKVVATVEDGKVTKVEQPGYDIVITGSTMSMLLGKEVVWAATYRIDASKTPAVMHQTVTRAPCGAGKELEEVVVFNGKSLKVGSMVLKRQQR